MWLFKGLRELWKGGEKEGVSSKDSLGTEDYPDPLGVTVEDSDCSDAYEMDEDEDIAEWEEWDRHTGRKPKYKYYRQFHEGDSGLEDDDMDGPGWTRRYQEFVRKAEYRCPKVDGRDMIFEDFVHARRLGLENAERNRKKTSYPVRLRRWKKQFIRAGLVKEKPYFFDKGYAPYQKPKVVKDRWKVVPRRKFGLKTLENDGISSSSFESSESAEWEWHEPKFAPQEDQRQRDMSANTDWEDELKRIEIARKSNAIGDILTVFYHDIKLKYMQSTRKVHDSGEGDNRVIE